jgi:4-amino-4-deoxy-L-arabinose transferase-like glycosyltransferase
MIFLVLVVTTVLRLINLGYSNLQGDEIKALFLSPQGQSVTDFLLTQRKGPIQFLITGAIKLITPDYSNEVLLRLPFALAGIASVFVFHKLLSNLFNSRLAFYASILLSVNGLFIAFSRIAQYQSFVILFSLLALYLLATSHKDKRRIYVAAIMWALSILSHYDGVFIAPMVGVLLLRWYKNQEISRKKKIKVITNFTLIFTFLIATFYIPFVLALTDGTLNYWQGRIASSGSKISSSQYLFGLYNPLGVTYFYYLFSLVGLFFAIRKSTLLTNGLLLWIAVPFIFMEIFVAIPGTHIYTYLIPTMVLVSLGITSIEKKFAKLHNKYLTKIYEIAVALILCFFTLTSYYVFVDNRYEYPWEDESIFGLNLSKPLSYYHLSLFGFPYNRTWEEVGEYLSSYDRTIPYTTNERSSISSYYIKNKRDGEKAGFYIEVAKPQSYMKNTTNKRILDWISVNDPLKVYYNPLGKQTAKIYLIPTSQSLQNYE